MMNVAVIGKGLIGGSLEKAALRAKHNAEIFRGRAQLPDLSRFDFVFLAVPPSAVEGKVREIRSAERSPILRTRKGGRSSALILWPGKKN